VIADEQQQLIQTKALQNEGSRPDTKVVPSPLGGSHPGGRRFDQRLRCITLRGPGHQRATSEPQQDRLEFPASLPLNQRSRSRSLRRRGRLFQAFRPPNRRRSRRGRRRRSESANGVARPILATPKSASPPQATTYAVLQRVSMGGTGLEPVTPSLSTWGSRSRQFARVRSDSIVERNPPLDRTLERTRTNANPCHSCHAGVLNTRRSR
jgi:hypothetical protein